MNDNNIPEEVKNIYSNFSDIKKELKIRWENKELEKEIINFFNNEYPFNYFKDGQYAFFSRDIITPNYEFHYFMDLAKDLNLKPVLFEYNGKFVAKNLTKYYSCKLYFYDTNKKNITLDKIVDFNIWEGKPMHQIITKNKNSLKEIHTEMLEQKFPEISSNIVDITEWFNKKRKEGNFYYTFFLFIFIRNGVLFENFLFDDKDESLFLKNKVLPSFDFVKNTFGIKPLIFPLLPIENEKDPSWLYYPHDLKDIFN